MLISCYFHISGIKLVDTCNNKERLKIIEDQCIERNQTDEVNADTFSRLFKHLLSDDKHHVIYCAIPKVACTSFKTMIANQTQKLKRHKTFNVHNSKSLGSIGLTHLSEFPMQEILRRLESYTKFIVVRHPFDRLMSAYKDKFIQKHYTKRYRQTIEELLGHERAPKAGQRISFEDFLQLIIDGYETGKFFNKHWASYMDLCHPCLVKYDHILKLETLGTDSRTALSLFLNEGETAVSMPHLNDKRPVEEKLSSVTQTFKQLNEPLVQAVMAIYAADFKLFGYQWDKTEGATCNSEKGQSCC